MGRNSEPAGRFGAVGGDGVLCRLLSEQPWFLCSYVLGIFLVEPLNEARVGGFPLGFWFAHQGSIYVFIVLILVYAATMDRLDRRYGVD